MLGCVWIDDFPATPSAVERQMALLLSLMEDLSPDLEIVQPGMILFDCRGVSAKNVKKLGTALIRSIEKRMGLHARVGVATTRFVAQVVAKQASRGQCLIVPREEEEAFLATQSVQNLPLENEILRRLEMLGLHTLGQLASMPIKALTRQFGGEGQRMAQLVRGIDTTPLIPEEAEEVFAEEYEFDVAVDDGEVLWATLVEKMGQLFYRLQDAHKFCTGLAFVFTLQVGDPLAFKVVFASPRNEVERVTGPVQERLKNFRLEAPVTRFQVVADGLVAAYAHQLDFTQDYVKSQKREHIQRVMERLEVRGSALWQVAWLDRENRLPERKACLQELKRVEKRRGLVLPSPAKVVANDAGIPQMMRTRDKWHVVDTVVESWELEDEWWNRRPIMRSYYRVILKNGGVHRLFRDGVDGRWYQQLR